MTCSNGIRRREVAFIEVRYNEFDEVRGSSKISACSKSGGLPVVSKAAEQVSQATEQVVQQALQQAVQQEGPPPSSMQILDWNDDRKWMLGEIKKDSKMFSFASKRLKADKEFVLEAVSAAHEQRGTKGSYTVFQAMDPLLKRDINYISTVFRSKEPGAYMVLDVLDDKGAAELINDFNGLDNFLQCWEEWYGIQPKETDLTELREAVKRFPIVSQGGTPPNVVENGSAL